MVARAIVDGVAGHGAVFTAAGRLLGHHSNDQRDDLGGDEQYFEPDISQVVPVREAITPWEEERLQAMCLKRPPAA